MARKRPRRWSLSERSGRCWTGVLAALVQSTARLTGFVDRRQRFRASKPHTSTSLVHNGAMRMANRTIRQSVSLPAGVAAQVRSLAKTRRLSANRMLVELIEDGMESQKRKQQQFFDLAERFRGAADPEEAKRLGDELGRMVFGG